MTIAAAPKLRQEWLDLLSDEFSTPRMQKLKEFLKSEKESGTTIYPKGVDIFRTLDLTPPDAVKVVILGQDPYHGENQANGLSFSVHKGISLPPSLLNIYKEIDSEYEEKMPRHGDLTGWAEQGVLLLNATLTVRQGVAGSHQGKGWEEFTDRVIAVLNEKPSPIVFMLWGSYAQKKGAIIDRTRHLVLTAPHPSPLSAHRGFLGCGHFKKANAYLEGHGIPPINWQKI